MTKHFPDAQPQPRLSPQTLSFGCPGASSQGPSVALVDAVTSVVLVVAIVSTVGSGGLVVDVAEVGSVSIPGVDGSAVVTPLDESPPGVGAGSPPVLGTVAEVEVEVEPTAGSAGRSGA